MAPEQCEYFDDALQQKITTIEKSFDKMFWPQVKYAAERIFFFFFPNLHKYKQVCL